MSQCDCPGPKVEYIQENGCVCGFGEIRSGRRYYEQRNAVLHALFNTSEDTHHINVSGSGRSIRIEIVHKDEGGEVW